MFYNKLLKQLQFLYVYYTGFLEYGITTSHLSIIWNGLVKCSYTDFLLNTHTLFTYNCLV